MDYISFTDAAEEKDCGRNTLYRAARDGRINAVEIAGRKLIIKDDQYAEFTPVHTGRRAARDTDA